MSDSSIPSVRTQNEGNESEPSGGGSSANTLGAPAPQADPPTDLDPSKTPDPDIADPDIKGDPDQVS